MKRRIRVVAAVIVLGTTALVLAPAAQAAQSFGTTYTQPAPAVMGCGPSA